MKNFTFTLFVILLFQTLSFGQDVCVKIHTIEMAEAGDNITVTAEINFLTNQTLKFIWESSNGTKQTSEKSVVVIPTTKDDAGREIEINLEVEGLPQTCLKDYLISVPIQPLIRHHHLPPSVQSNMN